MLNEYDSVTSVLAYDFLYGRVINAGLGSYLLDADLNVCCMPSVYCFASYGDAERFQRGFGGRILSFAEARQALVSGHLNACGEHTSHS
jgi:nitrous oxide reductase accessory protein NosL